MKTTLANSLTRLLAVAALAVAIAAYVGTAHGGTNQRIHRAPQQRVPAAHFQRVPAAHFCAQLVRSTPQAKNANSACSTSKSVRV